MAKGCVPAEPMASPRSEAVRWVSRRRSRSWAPASRVFLQGVVATSSTDSISSGLICPTACGRASSIASMEFWSSSVSESMIMSSSSIPSV